MTYRKFAGGSTADVEEGRGLWSAVAGGVTGPTDTYKVTHKDTHKDTSGGVRGSTTIKGGSSGGGGLFGDGSNGDGDPLGIGLLLGARTGIYSGKSS